MNYKESIDFVSSLKPKLDRNNPENFKDFLEFIDNPQDQINTIHIAGTNGKGSTIQFLSNILIQAGYKICAFVSPSLERLNERFLINNTQINDETFTRHANIIKNSLDDFIGQGGEELIEFEFIASMAFSIFKDINCHIALIETGIGGRYDSTNVINPIASIITTIDKDHEYMLGDNILDIASQKAGIIKYKRPVFSLYHGKEIDEILIDEANKKDTSIYFLGPSNIENVQTSEIGSSYDFIYKDIRLNNIQINLAGRHQIKNSALAIATSLGLYEVKLISLSETDIYQALKATSWPGRMEKLIDQPRFYIDGAHNQEGIRALIDSLKDFEYDRLILGFNMLNDKDVSYFVNKIEKIADIIICSQIDYYRSIPAKDLAEYFTKDVIIEKDLKKAIDKAINIAKDKDLIIFCGSLHLVGEVRSILKGSS